MTNIKELQKSLDEEVKELQPAYFRQLIKKGLMTEKESEQLVSEWNFRNKLYNITDEEREAKGIAQAERDAEDEEDERIAEEAEKEKRELFDHN